MIIEKEDAFQKASDKNEDLFNPTAENMDRTETSEEITQFYNKQILSAEQKADEITNNDGSVRETLDTAFHNEPGYIKNHSFAGSNRADYYEKRSQGKSDTEEEQEYMRNHQPE